MSEFLFHRSGPCGRSAARKAARFLGVFLLFLLPVSAAGQSADELQENARQFVQYGDAVIAITGVQVVDGTGAAPRSGQTVVIADRRIQSVGPDGEVEIPEGARRIDGSRHTVIPGLIGVHNHTFYTTAARHAQMNTTSPRLYLAAGVTTIRTTGSYSPYSEINMRRAIEAGEMVGPRMHITGPYISGSGAAAYMTQVSSPEDARRVVAYWAEEGATWFKAYTRISRAELGAAIDEAHRHGLRFTAHLCSVTFREAVDLGIDSLEHGFFTNTEYHPDKEPDECPPDFRSTLREVDIDSDEVNATIDHMVGNEVALTSTLAVYELSVPGQSSPRGSEPGSARARRPRRVPRPPGGNRVGPGRCLHGALPEGAGLRIPLLQGGRPPRLRRGPHRQRRRASRASATSGTTNCCSKRSSLRPKRSR